MNLVINQKNKKMRMMMKNKKRNLKISIYRMIIQVLTLEITIMVRIKQMHTILLLIHFN